MIFVGQAPARDGSTNLEGPGADRLIQVMGVTREEFLRHERVNLLDAYPGAHEGGGDLFLHELARGSAMAYAPEWNTPPSKIVILLGRSVQRAFLPICQTVDYFKPCAHGFITFYVHPHPSGVSRWWNDTENVRSAEAFWRRMINAIHNTPRE